MKTFDVKNIDNIQQDNNNRVVALGFFDGLHLAHQEIIKSTVEKAKKEGKVATLITFDKSPKEYFQKKTMNLITPIKLKKQLLEKYGIEELYILEFNEQLQTLTKEHFIDNILKKINTSDIFCGYDYVFGRYGSGTPEFLSKYTKNEINVHILPEKTYNNKKISTTNLREYIKNGNFLEFFDVVKRHYQLNGVVIKGRQLGRTINFPTANLLISDNYLLPEKLGVYITVVKVRGIYYKGITNIGNNPTVTDDNKLYIETNILDFDMDIYGDNIELYFYKYIRPEMKFSGLEGLKKQLELDKHEAENYPIDLEKFNL